MSKRTPKFHSYQDADGQWRWRLLAGNGEVVCQGEGHPTMAKAIRATRRVQRLAALAVFTQAEPSAPAGKPATKRAAAKPMTK